jgi:hypothetical protein
VFHAYPTETDVPRLRGIGWLGEGQANRTRFGKADAPSIIFENGLFLSIFTYEILRGRERNSGKSSRT